MKKLRLIQILLFSLLTFHSCNNSDVAIGDIDSIRQIVIQTYPTFHTHSLIICNPVDGEIVFDKLGNLAFLDEELNHDLTPFYYAFNIEEKGFLNDSIITLMKDEDFKGGDGQFLDGIHSDLLFVFESKTTKKITLSNYSTEIQAKLIDFLFNSILEHSEDSVNVKYAKIILGYHE